MTITASLFSGISGITSNGSALSVAGDNIANINTLSFKSSNAVFASNLTQRIGEVQVGLGSRLAATNTNFTQGAFATSARNTDLAIDGEGFFAVENGSGERFYTRAGSFSENNAGQLVTTVGGLNLLAYEVSDSGSVSGNLTNVDLSTVSSDPVASTEIQISGNLDPNAEVIAAGTPFDGSSFEAAQDSANFSVPSTMYDSRGTAHEVITYFRRTGANAWEHFTLGKMSDLDPATFGGGITYTGATENDTDTVVLRSGTATFDTDGALTAATFYDQENGSLPASAGANAIPWDDADVDGTLDGADADANPDGRPDLDLSPGEYLNAASDIPWVGADDLSFANFNLELGQTAGSGAVFTQFDTGNGSVATEVASDGRATGDLQSLEFTRDGYVRGIFDNGESRDLYQIPLALFANNQGLSRVGSNLYAATASSGDALLNAAGGNGRGDLVSFATEQSNVDLASEFVKIIQFQNGFSASSRTISAASELLANLVNLGR